MGPVDPRLGDLPLRHRRIVLERLAKAGAVLAPVAATLAFGASPALASGGTLTLLAGTGGYAAATAPGLATATPFLDAEGVTVAPDGDIYFASSDDGDVFKVDPAGQLTVVAGTSSRGWTAPGTITPGPATSFQLDFPNGVALDSAGDLYIADSDFNEVYKVTPDGTLSLFAGDGTYGAPTAGAATSSDLRGPADVAVAPDGDVYIADFNGNEVEKVTPSGTLSIVAGTGTPGTPTAGPAASSELDGPGAVAVDAAGDLFIADQYHSYIEEVTPSGTLSIVAGNGTSAASTAGPATSVSLNWPEGIAIAPNGDLYVTDNGSAQLVKISGGQLSIVAGTGVTGASTFGVPATSSEFEYPFGVALTPGGGLVMTDDGNNQVDLIGPMFAAPAQTVAPTVSGTPAIGQTLTAGTGTWDSTPAATYAYQWQRCDESGTTCTDISGATQSSYAVTALDAGDSLRVRVTATNSGGSTVADSAVTAVVPAAPTTTTSTTGTTTTPTTTGTTTTATTPTSTTPTSTTPTTPPSDHALTLSSSAVSAGLSSDAGGGVSLALQCPAAVSGVCTADGTLALALSTGSKSAHATISDKVIARFAGVKVQAGQKKLVAVKLSAASIRYLRERGIYRVRVTLTIHTTLQDGQVVTSDQKVWLYVPGLTGCRAASGSLSSTGIGALGLGMTRAQAHRVGHHVSGGYGFERYCVAGGAIRVAYATPTLAKAAHVRSGRVFAALTANHRYAVAGVHAHETVAAAAKQVKLGRSITIGANRWYVVRDGATTGILKVQHGKIAEIGVLESVAPHHVTERYLLTHM